MDFSLFCISCRTGLNERDRHETAQDYLTDIPKHHLGQCKVIFIRHTVFKVRWRKLTKVLIFFFANLAHVVYVIVLCCNPGAFAMLPLLAAVALQHITPFV